MSGLQEQIDALRVEIAIMAAYIVERDQLRPTDAAWKRLVRLAGE